MNPKYFAGFLLLLTAVGVIRSQTAETFPGFINLGRPTDRSMTINITYPMDLAFQYLEYGEQPDALSRQTAVRQGIRANQPCQEVLSDLAPNRHYYYRVRHKKQAQDSYSSSEVFTFHTQRAPGSTFRFCIQGDSHPERASQFDAELYRRTLRTAAADQPDFFMTIGDDFSVDTLTTVSAATVAERYTIQLPFLGLLAHSAPLFLVNGNHEQAARYLLDGTPNNVAVWAQNARNLYYAQPGPDSFYTGNTEEVPHIGLLRNYFAWEWGDALFVAIDPYWASQVPVDNVFGGGPKTPNRWDITHGEAQYRWLKRTLENSKAKWKFVFAHHVVGSGRGAIELAPYFEWGGKNQNDTWGFTANRPGWEMPIHALLVANRVTIFFQGHDHLFVRQQLDGVTYLELPEPADPTYTLWNSDAYTSGDKFSNTGYVRVQVSADQVGVEYIRTFLPKDEKPPALTNGMIQYSTAIRSVGDVSKVNLTVAAGGAASYPTPASSGSLRSGYAVGQSASAAVPHGSAVFGVTQGGVTVSEAAVPAAKPTAAARIFVEYASKVVSDLPNASRDPMDIFTGIALVNRGEKAAALIFTLRDLQGQTLAVGHGSLAPSAQRSRFLHQLQELAPDFLLPADFPVTRRWGTLEVSSDQPLALTALRMTVNQRGNTLFTTVPAADLAQPPSLLPLTFPHLANGEGYVTSFCLLNPSTQRQSGTLRFYSDDGLPWTVRSRSGEAGSSFPYTLPAGGGYLFQTDGSPSAIQTGSLQLIPDSGSSTPAAAGIFSRTSGGLLITEAGIPPATPTTHARIYLDMAKGHDSGLAIAMPASTPGQITLKAFLADGVTPAGGAEKNIILPGNGHISAYVGQWIGGLSSGFQGVLDIASAVPFSALTLRTLTNSRNDFLITTLPVADLTQTPALPILFPQMADGGGYQTEFILLSPSEKSTVTLSFFGPEGAPFSMPAQ